MRYALALVLLAAVVPVFASQPGQPLNCDDWVILEPGVTCGWHLPPNPGGDADLTYLYTGSFGPRRVADTLGRSIQVRRLRSAGSDCNGFEMGRTEIVRWDGAAFVILARVDDRCESHIGGSCVACVSDIANLGRPPCFFPADRGGEAGWFGDLSFDPVNGRLLVGLRSLSTGVGCSPANESWYFLAFSGFTTILDLFDSFEPRASALGCRVPQRPEGLRAADRFDTYWGQVSRPLDLSQAHPLQCAYPDHQPQVGEYLTYPDAAPTPAPGQAVYYLTSVTYQGETRAGRRTLDGRLSGRDVSRLPTCVAKTEMGR